MPADIVATGRAGEIFDALQWDDQGLITVVAQQHDSGEVLMVAYANRAALAQTLSTGHATYYSRSRATLWVKGATSGFTQPIVEVRTDCDGDVLLYRVDAPGAACHQLRRSCFSHRVDRDGSLHVDRPIIA